MKLENVFKYFIKNDNKINILENETIEFKEGIFYLITGNSGIGKSTLINILGLLDVTNKGNYYIDGINTTKLNDNELSNIRKEKIGMIFQNHYLNPRLTALENALLPTFLNSNSYNENKQKTIDLFEQMGIISRLNHYPKELSGGEAQRICIIRALANNPKYILADEPTGNLDPQNAKLIYGILKDLARKGHCVIVVSHDEKAFKYADKILEFNNFALQEKGGKK